MGWFADNAVQTGPASPFRIEGKEAIGAAYGSAFQNFPTRLYVPRQRLIRVFGDTTAVTNVYYTLTQVDRSGKPTTTHGRLDVNLCQARRPMARRQSALLDASTVRGPLHDVDPGHGRRVFSALVASNASATSLPSPESATKLSSERPGCW